ncbi:hypothetical protein DV736_g5782, partial [Chaetothyriales sp. CBS 134916]
MLANLFSGSSKTVTNLESKTEEDHSRSLLWPPHLGDPTRSLSLAPSSTAVASPTFRPGGYDDRGGLELNESKDVRIIIAQDAFGSLDRPLVLFDSYRHFLPEPPSQPQRQAVASSSPIPSPLHSPRKLQANPFNAHQRNRSTTFSGTTSPWSRPARDVESHDKVNRLLDCMFGVTSATKSESSTKMHVLLAGQEQPLSHSQTSPALAQHQFPARAPVSRSNTSNQIGAMQRSLRMAKDDESVSEDVVLVTRMFTVTLSESKEALPKTPKAPPKTPDGTTQADETSPGKRAKLIEKKVPMYAVAIMIQLPPDEAKKSGSRPVSRTSPLSTSFPNSLGSEVASSWTLLETIPDSLSSSTHSQKSADRRIENITNTWDVMLRSLSHLEAAACVEIERMLHDVNMQFLTFVTKTPKGPYEQRTNQRNIYLRSGFAQEDMQKMLKVVRQTQRRICLALRIPKAVTGAGFLGGHWLDEARYLVQLCAAKAQEKFLYSLLSAYLDTHTEWLENMGFDCFRKQGHMHCRPSANSIALAARTVIIADRRSLARRLIFLLASFLPSARGINALENANENLKSPLHNPNLLPLYLRNPDPRQVGAKDIISRHNRAQHVSFGNTDFIALSTSASSETSIASKPSYKRSKPHLTHRDSDISSLRRLTRVSTSQGRTHSRKASTTDPAVTPLPATSMPFISSQCTGYFDEEAIDEGSDIKASVGLQNILHRDSSSFTPSSTGSTWGTLFGGLWTRKHEGSHASASSPSTAEEPDLRRTPSGSSTSHVRRERSKLEPMVHEAAAGVPVPRKEGTRGLKPRSEDDVLDMSPHEVSGIEPPRLRVNEDDGVVDVDVGIPGFLGWDREDGPMSPSKPPGGASSLRSLDGAASLHSSVSHRISQGQPGQPDDSNVAGYLKRYHEDFALQAVAYYDDLPKEIMDSMSRQPKPLPLSHPWPSDNRRQGPDEGWVVISSTLVVDTRRFSLERLHLMRRRIPRPLSSGDSPRSPQNRPHSHQADYEEAFFLETIDRPDTIIANATEAMLDQTGPPSASTPSQSANHTGSQLLLSTPPLSAAHSLHPHSPSSDCWYDIANALNAVVIRVVNAKIWVHDDKFSTDDVLINEAIIEGSGIREGDLIEIINPNPGTDDAPFQSAGEGSQGHPEAPSLSRYLCLAKFAQAEFKAKQVSLQVSIKANIATVFGFQNGTQIQLSSANLDERTASHVEFTFRDTYLARSDIWRLVGQELAGKTIYVGQRITFLGSIKLVIKSIHVSGHRVSTAFFSGLTVPIFRSETARYVIFIQMSREMWDFDSEGNGEILFSRVINGFLPDLFKRWTELEVRHLVSIILFGRHEYGRFDFAPRRETLDSAMQSSLVSSASPTTFQDFYSTVVTDMASAQWTTILNELKRYFRVFLRDVSLYPPKNPQAAIGQNQEQDDAHRKITGRLSVAMKGNILEAINLGITQFSDNDEDRDLIRTGVSAVVITAGAGVFEVDRELLKLTSENITNNGMGIDIVCLSRMPLHSVPLFKYRSPPGDHSSMDDLASNDKYGTHPTHQVGLESLSAGISIAGSPAISLMNSYGLRSISRYSSSFHYEYPGTFCYGVPQWVDLSYWSPDSSNTSDIVPDALESTAVPLRARKSPFVPRVRMYEIQMMGLMEMGMADVSIPFLKESSNFRSTPRRLKRSRLPHGLQTRSLSTSPTWSRKVAHLGQSPIKAHPLAGYEKSTSGKIFRQMDDYDAALFSLPKTRTTLSVTTSSPRPARLTVNKLPRSPVKLTGFAGQESPLQHRTPATGLSKMINQNPPLTSELANPMSSVRRTSNAARASRTTSYALRGLAPVMRATASTEVNVENAQAEMPKTHILKARPTMEATSESFRSLSMKSERTKGYKMHSATSSESSIVTGFENSELPTTPIRIKTSPQAQVALNDRARQFYHLAPSRLKGSASDDIPPSQLSGSVPSGSDSENSVPDDADLATTDSSLPSSVPKSKLPFVRNVNASNPLKYNPNKEAYFGQWQHLYPRKPRSAQVKWRSLCTPASVPLTTEDFPSEEALEEEYEHWSYMISLSSSTEMIEKPRSRDELYRELLSLRFARGYQLAVGPRANKFEGLGINDHSFFFNPDIVRTDGQFVFMTMGNTIQKLTLVDKHNINVAFYEKKHVHGFPKELEYRLYMRTIMAPEFKEQVVPLRRFAENYPWEQTDRYLTSPKQDIQDDIKTLRFWRARFVLLPVPPPEGAFRPTAKDSEENEEEIHLRGIRALTKMWQKSRYLPPEERRQINNRVSSFKRKDRNPLRINLETLNPSELVATELDKLLAAEEAGDVQIAQLLPEDEQFERESAALGKLAAAIQGDRGIEIKNRRWHLRLHYSCFVGDEFTNWLVQNFRDVDTREEAIDLGNELMKEGLFEHVNGHHNFKDGNFFYSIKAEWRVQRGDLRQSWFNPTSRRSDRTSTLSPFTDQQSRDSSLGNRSRSGTNLTSFLHQSGLEGKPSSQHTLTSKRLNISLSKAIRLDVDPRRKSNRPETVTLHYDRVHNPENCYHLELSWLNATSRLVDDAIVAWTTQAEKYGLKLIEVPITEVSKIPAREPFRGTVRITLAETPPSKAINESSNSNVYFTATPFSPHTSSTSDKHFYHKQLLRHFDFVLDMESQSEFPSNVEITYSWARSDAGFASYLTPERVCEELQSFCSDRDKLLTFYNQVSAAATAAATVAQLKEHSCAAAGSGGGATSRSNSSLLRPVREAGIMGGGDGDIPEFELPEAVAAPGRGGGGGVGVFGFNMGMGMGMAGPRIKERKTN